MLNIFKRQNNSIEAQFKRISITGRMAFAIKCLEQFILENKNENRWLNRLTEVLWEFTSSKDLRVWDKNISDLDPNNIMDKHPDNKPSDYASLTEKEFYDLKSYYSELEDDLLLLIDLTIDVGTSNLYGATGKYSKKTLDSVLRIYRFAQENLNIVPEVDKFSISKYSEKGGWGNSIKKSAFE